MGRIFDEMVRFFEQDDWHVTPIEGETALRLGFAGTVGRWSCIAQAREPDERFVFYSLLPIKVPEGQRLAMADFLTRANYGMLLGNFEMDFSDGEVRYKTSIDLTDTPLTHSLAHPMVYANVMTVDRYFQGVVAVAFGSMDPEAALASIEDSH